MAVLAIEDAIGHYEQARSLILLDFCRQYETEALLRAGEERQARAEVHRLGERVGLSVRLRLPYLRSLAVLATWEGHSERAIDHLHEAAQLAKDLGLSGERWQIQAALATLYEAGGQHVQACTAFAEAARLIQGLTQGIGDEALHAHFLAAPQIQQVLQHVQSESPCSRNPTRSRDTAEASGATG